ncbi:MAG: hypothetical protein R2991_13020 [Thermoanaerobaculia bacterium]
MRRVAVAAGAAPRIGVQIGVALSPRDQRIGQDLRIRGDPPECRVEDERSGIVLHRSWIALAPMEDVSQPVVGPGVAGVDLEDPVEPLLGPVELPGLELEEAEVVERQRTRAVDRQRAAIGLPCVVGRAEAHEEVAQVVPGLRGRPGGHFPPLGGDGVDELLAGQRERGGGQKQRDEPEHAAGCGHRSSS